MTALVVTLAVVGGLVLIVGILGALAYVEGRGGALARWIVACYRRGQRRLVIVTVERAIPPRPEGPPPWPPL